MSYEIICLSTANRIIYADQKNKKIEPKNKLLFPVWLHEHSGTLGGRKAAFTGTALTTDKHSRSSDPP